MELFKIANGPWERLFNGTFQEHETEVYANPEKILMVLVYEKKLDRAEGAIVELYKVFHATGDVESFTETLPREALIVTKHDENLTMKFLLLGSKPTYVRWVEDEFIKEVDSLVKRLETSSVLIKDVSKAYELKIEDISESTEDVRKAFFEMPMLPPLLATSAHPGIESEAAPKRQAIRGEVMLGTTRDRQRVVEPLDLFMKSAVTEGTKLERARIMVVLGESALLSNTPAIFFDFNKSFSGIGEANRNLPDIQKSMVEIDPLGFPLKSFKPRESLRIDLNILKPGHLAESFGVGDKDFARILGAILENGKVSSIEQLIELVSKTAPTEEFSEFEVLKAARILKLISIRYPFLFGAENDIEEMARQGTSNIARAAVLEFENIDERSTTLICHSLIREIFEYYKNMGPSHGMRVMLIVPSPRLFSAKERQKLMAAELISMAKDFQKYGIGIAIGSDHLIDVEPEMRSQAEAEINIVSGNDASVQLKNRKAYRVLVRPALSRMY